MQGRCRHCNGTLHGEARDPGSCDCPTAQCARCRRWFNTEDEGGEYRGAWYCDRCHPLDDDGGEWRGNW